MELVSKDSATHSDNPVVRIIAHNTSAKQADAITIQRVKLHARHGSVNANDVEDLLEDAVDAGELETTAEGGFFVPE